MARRKNEVALQTDLINQESWDEVLCKPGLHVVDVYADWCGPCKAVQDYLRKVRNDVQLDADFLHYSTANADTVNILEPYKGTCEPCFMMFGGKTLVAVVRGVNPPLLCKTIIEQLQKEKRVMGGEIEREEFIDTKVARSRSRVDGEKAKVVEKETTLVILKPDMIANEREEEFLAKIRSWGYEVLERETRTLAEDEVNVLFSDQSGDANYPGLVEHMTSGPSSVLVISQTNGTGRNIAEYFHDVLLGPAEITEAKELAPYSLRALYGTDPIRNGIYASSNRENAARELRFFFPGFTAPTMPRPKLERTIAVIRPEAVKYEDEIVSQIQTSGFKVMIRRTLEIDEETARKYYAKHSSQPYFEDLIAAMTSGPLVALQLEKEGAIIDWHRLVGPGYTSQEAIELAPFSLRARFPVDRFNCLHAAFSEKEARRDIKYFFPVQRTVGCLTDQSAERKEEIFEELKAAGFVIRSVTVVELTDEEAKEFFGDDSARGGTVTLFVAERFEAVKAFQEISQSESLREAVYASPNQEHVERFIQLVKPDENEPEAFDDAEEDEDALDAAPLNGPPRDAEEAPAADEAPSFERAPAADEALSFERAPAADEAPSFERAPAADEAPSFERAPAAAAANAAPRSRAPAADEAPSFERAPAADEAPRDEDVAADAAPQETQPEAFRQASPVAREAEELAPAAEAELAPAEPEPVAEAEPEPASAEVMGPGSEQSAGAEVSGEAAQVEGQASLAPQAEAEAQEAPAAEAEAQEAPENQALARQASPR